MTLLNIEILGLQSDVWNLIISGIILILVLFMLRPKTQNVQNTAPVQSKMINASAVSQCVASDLEVVAVISAAIAAFAEQDGKNYTIKSITPVKKERNLRSAWGNAGVLDNTRTF